MTTTVLVVGCGAREHAIAWRLSKDDGVTLHAAPGNGGTAQIATNHSLDVNDNEAVVALAKSLSADLVVIGPEAPLVSGVVDALQDVGIAAFGPGKTAAQLEGSKSFSKEFMARHKIPTAGFAVFDDADAARAYIDAANRPLVVKADGLAAGKGVIIAKDAAEANEGVDRIMRERAFGSAGDRVLIEECLMGPEVSYHVVSDGERFIAMAPAQDHKRIFEGDKGPNTGGMGAYSPPPMVDAIVEEKIIERLIRPTLDGMAAEGTPFRGALFVGLMIVDGEPQVLEYNTRFGDPEAETLMTRWKGDALPLFMGSARGDFGGLKAQWEAPASMCVVLASGGYPGAYEKGKPIEGLDAAAALPNVQVFQAGTRIDGDATVTAGGRVLAVTAIGANVEEAAERAYAAVDRIKFEGMQLRRDIGWQTRTPT